MGRLLPDKLKNVMETLYVHKYKMYRLAYQAASNLSVFLNFLAK